jgi:two-component system, cell cycle sensor histidine kinase and response regulator CckA
MSHYPRNLPLAVFAAESEGRLRFRLPLVTYTNLFEPAALTVWMSPQVEAITGYRADEWVGHPGFFESILFPDDRESVLEEVRSSRAELRPFSRDYRLVTRSGRVVWVHDESVPVLDAAGEPEFIQGYFVDLSKRKELERELLHAQKTEALGLLAAEIAHDFNNYLTAIRGYADLGLLSTASDHPARKDLIEIAQTAERATKLTQQLLAFGRRLPLEPQRIHLDKVVCDLASMLGQVAGWRIDLVFDLSPTPLVYADAGQLGQAVVNLVSNARDAMPAGGTLTLRTSCARLRQGTAAAMRLDLPPGVYVELSICDTGTGMDEETKAQVFDPFFTTKTSARGTGLGLSIVHGIIRQSGGAVDVTSAPGHGTTFRLLLPSLQ